MVEQAGNDNEHAANYLAAPRVEKSIRALGETGIDVFRQPLDKLRPHVTFTPQSEPIA